MDYAIILNCKNNLENNFPQFIPNRFQVAKKIWYIITQR